MKKYLPLIFAILFVITSAAWAQTVLGVEAAGPDKATKTAFDWREKNVYTDIYANNGFKVILLDKSNKGKVSDALRDNKVTHITGCGHGSGTRYTGYGQSTVFYSGDAQMLKKLKGIHVHLLSCQTARQLGKDMVKNGAASYAGYYPNFSFTWKSYPIFFGADAAMDQAFADGKSASQAYQQTVDKFNEFMEVLKKNDPSAVRYLVVDRDGLRCYGGRTEQAPAEIPLEMARQILFAKNPQTGKFMTLAEYFDSPARAVGYASMPEREFRDMIVASYERMDRDFELGILFWGVYNRDQIISEIVNNTELGREILSIERRFLEIVSESRYTKTISVQSDAAGSIVKSGAFDVPMTVTVTGARASWKSGKNDFANASISLNGVSLFQGHIQNGQKVSINKKIKEGKSQFNINAAGGPANTAVTIKIYISIW